MKKWIKRYLILTVCFAIAIIPVFSILSQIDFFKEGNGPLIMLIIIGSLAVIFYTVMTILMIVQRKRIDKNARD